MAELSGRKPAATQTFCNICGDHGGVNGTEFYLFTFFGHLHSLVFLKLEMRAQWWSQFCTLRSYWDSTKNNPGLKAKGLNCFDH